MVLKTFKVLCDGFLITEVELVPEQYASVYALRLARDQLAKIFGVPNYYFYIIPKEGKIQL